MKKSKKKICHDLIREGEKINTNFLKLLLIFIHNKLGHLGF